MIHLNDCYKCITKNTLNNNKRINLAKSLQQHNDKLYKRNQFKSIVLRLIYKSLVN